MSENTIEGLAFDFNTEEESFDEAIDSAVVASSNPEDMGVREDWDEPDWDWDSEESNTAEDPAESSLCDEDEMPEPGPAPEEPIESSNVLELKGKSFAINIDESLFPKKSEVSVE